jgi:hypothetical protein
MMNVTQAAKAGPTLDQWEYLMLEVVPWLDGWQYHTLDDRGIPQEHLDFPYDWEAMKAPGLNAYGEQGWEVAGVMPEMHLYDREGKPYHSTRQTVLLLKRRKA